MLVIARKPQESIRVTTPTGDVLTIHFLREQGGKAVLGLEMPKAYHILRTELEPFEQPTNPPAKAA